MLIPEQRHDLVDLIGGILSGCPHSEISYSVLHDAIMVELL